ncbi:NmrA family NAD(P)-binding protein [Chroococcidiopsis sp. TS-821]|uniref:NmrA family NAD(P)-binding protein n=1 Tax=Chroococcidiopsis sp. TS-821 TaxID=1378066 RepID=UPI000D493A01|nr:NmrA family NAD(P)-binding protein [Chroococcidiopsis sp. TS-821]PPS45840.1 hypothetical protein B1A85_06310 [Chroococcidiopsis sp. TS-821]
MNRSILVTGATGNVGREVVRLFYDEGYYIKAAVRNLQNIDNALTPQVEYVVIDVRDIVAVVVKALTEYGHENQAHALTGDKALDYYQVADLFAQVLGTSVVYTNPSILQFFIRMYQRGLSLPFIAV